VQSAHDAKYGLTQQLKQWASENAVVVRVDELTAGAACTVLAAEHFINTSDPLMIANSDQWIDMSIEDYLRAAEGFQDGSIMTMDANDPKWSFVETAADGHVLRVVEKEVISSTATVGIYNFARGSDFVSAAKEMVEANERVNGEFYVAPVYNRLIRTGAQVGTFSIGSEANGMYGLGIPADLELFLNLPVCGKALAPFQASRPAQ
jgi:dTDP-glucose pyrophosphorylase